MQTDERWVCRALVSWKKTIRLKQKSSYFDSSSVDNQIQITCTCVGSCCITGIYILPVSLLAPGPLLIVYSNMLKAAFNSRTMSPLNAGEPYENQQQLPTEDGSMSDPQFCWWQHSHPSVSISIVVLTSIWLNFLILNPLLFSKSNLASNFSLSGRILEVVIGRKCHSSVQNMFIFKTCGFESRILLKSEWTFLTILICLLNEWHFQVLFRCID